MTRDPMRGAAPSLFSQGVDSGQHAAYLICKNLHVASEAGVSATAEDARAELLKAMAHPVRLRILEELVRDEECVCHLSALLRRSQPYISQQLAALKEAGLIADRRDSQRIYYRLTDRRLGDLLSSLSVLAGHPQDDDEARRAVLGCPCPKCDPSAH